MMKFKKMTALALTGALAFGLCACGSSASSGSTSSVQNTDETTESTSENDTASESTSADDSDLKEINLVLDWYPNAIHTFLYEAIDNGYFAEEGLKVNLISPADSVDALNFVASGKAEIGLSYPIETVQAVSNDMPVSALAAVTEEPIECFCSLKENTDITSDLSSLKDKKIGYSGTASLEATIKTITKNAGLTEDDYELINIGFDIVTSLTTKSVDVVFGAFVNDEVVTMENAGYELNVYYPEDYGVPDCYGLVMVVNKDSYTADPETYKGFLKACKKGFADMTADEDQALNVIMTDMNSDDNPLDEDQQRQSYEILTQRMQTEDAEFLSMQEDQWQATIDWMKETELIDKDLSASDVMVSE